MTPTTTTESFDEALTQLETARNNYTSAVQTVTTDDAAIASAQARLDAAKSQHSTDDSLRVQAGQAKNKAIAAMQSALAAELIPDLPADTTPAVPASPATPKPALLDMAPVNVATS